MPQVQIHPFRFAFDQEDKQIKFQERFTKDVETLISTTPNLGQSWYDIMGRVNKESKDVLDAVCAGKPWSCTKELYELAVVCNAICLKMQSKPLLQIS